MALWSKRFSALMQTYLPRPFKLGLFLACLKEGFHERFRRVNPFPRIVDTPTDAQPPNNKDSSHIQALFYMGHLFLGGLGEGIIHDQALGLQVNL